jgi:sugar lactone lactonase YvrE
MYMSSGNTVYRFDAQSGALLNSATVDPSNVQAQGLDFGPDGRLYAAVSNGQNRIVSFDTDLSNKSTFVTEGQGGLFTPYGLSFNGDGDLLVNSYNQQTVDRFHGPASASPGGNFPSGANSGAIFVASVGHAVGMATAPDGTVYMTRETSGGEISIVNSTGTLTTVATGLGSTAVGDLAINAAGTRLFARDANTILEYIINPDHTLTQHSFTLGFTNGTSLDSSRGLAFGPDGFLYADERLQNSTPGLPSTSNYDWVVRINPNTGQVNRFVTGGSSTFVGSQPTFLTFAPTVVPEPSSLVILTSGIVGLIGYFRLKRGRGVENPEDPRLVENRLPR